MRLCRHGLLAVVFSGTLAFGQASPSNPTPPVPVRDPQAVTLLSQALARLKSSPLAVTDVTLTATAAYTAGSDHETGTATLEAASGGSHGTVSVPWDMSRVVLNLDNGERQEIRNGRAGAWIGTDGAANSMALHNCWVDADWFYPLLTLESTAADPTASVTSGASSASAEDSHSRESGNPNLIEILLSRVLPGQSAAVATEIQKLSTIHLYLDASTFLPVEIDFNVHPDRDANRDIPVEIEYSDYRSVSGVLVPYHIQKYVQHSLLLDLHVNSASVNSGLTASEFALPATTGGAR